MANQDWGWSWFPLLESTTPNFNDAPPYLPVIRPEHPLVSDNDLTTPADFVLPPPPALAQPSYHKAQTKKVIKHARAELMEEVRKVGHNYLVEA